MGGRPIGAVRKGRPDVGEYAEATAAGYRGIRARFLR